MEKDKHGGMMLMSSETMCKEIVLHSHAECNLAYMQPLMCQATSTILCYK